MPSAVHLLLAGLLLVSACTAEPGADAEGGSLPTPGAQPVPAPGAEVIGGAYGQTIYVPVYSHIYYHDDRRVFNLAATLSIRNTALEAPIAVTAVRYFDSEGRLVRSYLDAPRRLGPLASADFVVEIDDTSGGSGANFIVEWRAEVPVTEPVVEAVMISTASSQGISFVSPGRVLESLE